MIKVGQRFGRLVVVALLGRLNNTTFWVCQCDCGNRSEVRHGQLQGGKTKSAFYAHMGPCPPFAQLDRIENDKGYEPGNCRWATKVQQANNTRANRFITAFGKRKTLAEWSREFGVRSSTIAYRLRQTSMTREEAVSLQTMNANNRAMGKLQ